MLPNMAACPVVDQHCPCAYITWWNLLNKLWKLCLWNTKMFTSQKIGRMVFSYFNFDKILTHANAIDGTHAWLHTKINSSWISYWHFFIFQQKCLASGNTCNKASNVKNRTKTSYDVTHVGQRMPDKVCYRPPDLIDHRTLDDNPCRLLEVDASVSEWPVLLCVWNPVVPSTITMAASAG